MLAERWQRRRRGGGGGDGGGNGPKTISPPVTWGDLIILMTEHKGGVEDC